MRQAVKSPESKESLTSSLREKDLNK